MDIFFYEAFSEELEALKSYLPSHIKAGYTANTIQENKDLLPPAPFISIRTQSLIPLQWGPQLSGILSRTTGYDHARSYLEKAGRKIPSGYLPLYCSRSVAEQAMLLWMSLLRKLPKQIEHFLSFNRDGLTGVECEHKILLVVGVGNIGHHICRIGQGLGMEVLGVDIVEKHPAITYVSREEGIKTADIIVCAMNLTEENRGYFKYQLLKKAKPGVLFVNIARGELSPSTDLIALLNEKHLGGVALDVYDKESELAVSLRTKNKSHDSTVTATLELAKHTNVILTPHNAFNTKEALDRKALQSIEQIEHFLKKGSFIWDVPV